MSDFLLGWFVVFIVFFVWPSTLLLIWLDFYDTNLFIALDIIIDTTS